MRGVFRGVRERARIREHFSEDLVPVLTRKEILPLLRFFPEQTGLRVFDIGANKGLWTRALLDVFGDRIAHVDLFDPSPENYAELTNRKDNLAGMTEGEFERSSVWHCAMGSRPGRATLYTNEEGSPLGSLYPHQEAGWMDSMKHVRLSQELEVPVDTVDRFIARSEIPSVDILKIDTEGHEMEVMLGAEQAIAADRVDLITFEFGVHQVESRHFFKDYWLHLTQRNYSLYFIDYAGGVTPIERYEYRWEQFNRNVEYIAARLPLQPAPVSEPSGGDHAG